MDRVARRYADPFAFMEAYLRCGRFYECVRGIIDALNREAEDWQEEKLWQVWLHRYQGKESFGDWKESIRSTTADHPKPTTAEPGDMSRSLEIASHTLAKLRRSQKGGD